VKLFEPEGLNDLRSRLPVPAHLLAAPEPWLVTYLERATVFIVSPGIERDVVDGETITGTGSILTDGVWAWADTVAFAVSRHHLALPTAFVEHARAHPLTALAHEDLLGLRLE
jgi:hypothetical protein